MIDRSFVFFKKMLAGAAGRGIHRIVSFNGKAAG